MSDAKKCSNILDKSQSKNFSIKTIELDVDDDKSAENAITEITINENGIDILVNNTYILQNSNRCPIIPFIRIFKIYFICYRQ
jgi:short-subunit dehydrogenase involved in D-alanine esterification of teichoic acids